MHELLSQFEGYLEVCCDNKEIQEAVRKILSLTSSIIITSQVVQLYK